MKITIKLMTCILVTILVTPVHATIWNVEASNYIFTPDNLPDVKVGDTIQWIWIEGSHTTTSSDIPAEADTWDEPLTSSDMEFSYVPAVTGTYDYVCTPHATIGMVGSFTVQAVGGVNEESAGAIKIFPNPFQNEFTITSLEKEGIKISSLKIYNVDGKVIFSKILENSPRTIDFDMAKNEAGIYFIEIVDREGKMIRQKAIKSE